MLTKFKKLLNPEIRAKNIDAFQIWLRERYFLLRRPALPDPIFVIGCCRAGTTVTFETIARSREVKSLGYSTPEFWDGLYGPHHNHWASEAAGAEDAQPRHRQLALAHFFARLGPGRYVDKTCINVIRIPYLLALFPRAHFVFIYRDGRDNISSLIDGWRVGGPFGLQQFLGPFPEPVAIDDGRFQDWHFILPPGWKNYNHAPLEEVCAFQWLATNQCALDAKALVPESQWSEIRYEHLLDRPVEVFRNTFERLGLPFTDELESHCRNLSRHQTSTISGGPQKQKWRRRNPDEIARIQERIAPMMQRFGYSMDD